MITGIPAAFLAASGVYGIALTRELLLPNVAPLFAAAIVLMLGLLIPHLDLVARAGRWLLAGVAAALALGLLLIGSVTAGFDARHPQPDSITYALNLDTGQAVWESADERPDAWTSQFLGANPRTGSVADYIGDPDPRLHSPAPTVPLAAPSVRLLDRSNRDGLQTLTVRVTAPARANMIVLEVGSEVIGAAIDGKPVPDRPLANSSSASPWSINFWNPPTRGFDLRLKIRDTGPVRVTARAGDAGSAVDPRHDLPGSAAGDHADIRQSRIDRTGLLDGGDQVVQFHGAVAADSSQHPWLRSTRSDRNRRDAARAAAGIQ